VIIGAGLAGPSAGHALRDREVVILEREARALVTH
jgi:flavin-dependent dehydrogenase